MAIHKKGLAHWEGDLKHGKGTVSTESGALSQQPYGFNTRFEGVKGTNPEELIGAAHAACFSMALSLMLSEEGYTATSIDTTAVVTLNKTDGGFAITDIALQSQIVLPDVAPAAFDEIIQKAKAGCPVSQVLKANITLDYQLNPYAVVPARSGHPFPISLPALPNSGIFCPLIARKGHHHDRHSRDDRGAGARPDRHGAKRDRF